MKALGRMLKLPGGRIVFLAEHPEEPGTFLVGFKNSDGDDTKLILSAKALDALVALRGEPDLGKPEREFPFKKQPEIWRLASNEQTPPQEKK